MNNVTDDSSYYLNSPAAFAAIFALVLWSGTAIANKIAVAYMDGLTAGVLRSLLAGSVAVVVALYMNLSFPKTNRDRLLLCVSGITSFAIWPILLSVGIEFTTAGHAALIMAMIPVFTVFISSTIQRQFPGVGWWFGAVIALGATTILISKQGISFEVFTDGSSLMGDLIIFAGCMSCSIGYVAGGKLSSKIGTVATTFWGLSVALVVLIPVFSIIVGHTAWAEVHYKGWFAVGWMTLLSSLAGYILWFYALGRGGIGRIGSLQLVMPVITLGIASILLGEILTVFLITACAAIILGTFLAHRYSQ